MVVSKQTSQVSPDDDILKPQMWLSWWSCFAVIFTAASWISTWDSDYDDTLQDISRLSLHSSDFGTLDSEEQEFIRSELRRTAGRLGGVRGVPKNYVDNSSDIYAASSSSSSSTGPKGGTDKDYDSVSVIITNDNSDYLSDGYRRRESMETIMQNVLKDSQGRRRVNRYLITLSTDDTSSRLSDFLSETAGEGSATIESSPGFRLRIEDTEESNEDDLKRFSGFRLARSGSTDGYGPSISNSRPPSTDPRERKL